MDHPMTPQSPADLVVNRRMGDPADPPFQQDVAGMIGRHRTVQKRPNEPSASDDLSDEEKTQARAAWPTSKCTWCGGLHMRACPRVASFEFANDGQTVTKVTFWADGTWPDEFIIWPEGLGWGDTPVTPPAS